MGLRDWLRARLGRIPSTGAKEVVGGDPVGTSADVVDEAGHAAATGAYDRAIRLLAGARGTLDEAAVLDAILISLPLPVDDADRPIPEGVATALADVLVERGERGRAIDLLRRAAGIRARARLADLLGDDRATAEELERALLLYADLLEHDPMAPGIHERWQRLRARLGRGPVVRPAPIGATLLSAGPATPFTIDREVARGGSGVVYRAREILAEGLERTIALKLAHAGAAARKNTLHEAQSATRFRGPGVVPIFDCDPEEGWIAMAWADRGSLRDALGDRSRAPLADPRVALRPIVEALADLHRSGFVHGDVKPANVLFSSIGGAWLGDFALARAVGAPATAGSVGYLSPERLAGAPCHPRDDVYGLGKIFEAVSLDRLAARCLGRDRPETSAEVLELLITGT
jgi:serine/threonine-protein kinase